MRREVLAVDAGDRAGTADDRPLGGEVVEMDDALGDVLLELEVDRLDVPGTGDDVQEQDEQAEEPGGAPHAARV